GLDGAEEPLLAAEVEVGLHLDRRVIGAEAQVLGDGRRLDDLARVHEPVGVERTLDVYERLVEPVAEQSPFLVRTDEAVAVLAAPGAAVLEHQLEDLCAYVPVRVQAGFVLQVQERPDVDYANGGVCVHDDARAVALTDLHDLRDVEGQLVDGYRGVF